MTEAEGDQGAQVVAALAALAERVTGLTVRLEWLEGRVRDLEGGVRRLPDELPGAGRAGA